MSTCSLAGCTKPAYCKTLCSTHYNQAWREANKGTCPCGRAAHSRGLCHSCLAADRGYGTCECGRPARYKTGECHACLTRRRYHESKAGIARQEPVRKDTLTYEGAHARVKRDRGTASAHQCSCGAQASDWAVLHDAPDLYFVEYAGMTVPVSNDPAHYEPLCRACHVATDRAAKRQRVAA